jgi:hypothetical protein
MVAGWFLATAFLPRWWAERVAAVADGSLTAGLFAGLTCGAVVTAGSLLALRPAVRRRSSWAARWVWLVVAALIAVPGLTTLGIVLGTDETARTGRQIMDRDAPGFIGATAVGAVLGALGVVALWIALYSRRRRGRELQRLRAELHRHEERERAERERGTGDA